MVIIFVILEIEETIGLCARIHVRMNRLGELAQIYDVLCVYVRGGE